jgi:hypothetical protein
MPGKRRTTEELAADLAAAVSSNDTKRAIELARQIEYQLTSSLPKTAAAKPAEPAEGVLAFAAAPTVVPVRKVGRVTGSARQTVTAALAEIGVPVKARVAAVYAEARFGERVDPRAFSALRRDERRAWASSSPRPTYVVPALEGRYFQPIRGLLALSDWALERRLIGPWSERADHLAATAQLARQLAWLNERDPQVAERLASVVASMARSIPGAIEGRDVDTARVVSAAEAEREELAARDEPWRTEAAARARHVLGATEQLWGSSVRVVAEGGE